MEQCIFCRFIEDTKAYVTQNEYFYARLDSYPVNKGHTIIIPKRHFSSYFDITEEENLALLQILKEIKRMHDREYRPDGYNIGINEGADADIMEM